MIGQSPYGNEGVADAQLNRRKERWKNKYEERNKRQRFAKMTKLTIRRNKDTK